MAYTKPRVVSKHLLNQCIADPCLWAKLAPEGKNGKILRTTEMLIFIIWQCSSAELSSSK